MGRDSKETPLTPDGGWVKGTKSWKKGGNTLRKKKCINRDSLNLSPHQDTEHGKKEPPGEAVVRAEVGKQTLRG